MSVFKNLLQKGWGESCQMVSDLTAEDWATMESGQRRLHVWQGGTLSISVKDAQDHDKRVSMHYDGCWCARDEHHG